MASRSEDSLLSNRISNSTGTEIQDLLCSICLDIVWQPITCGSCLHFFCSKCLNDWLNKPRKICPMRCETFNQGQFPEFVTQRLAQLGIKCIYHSQGCKEVID